MSTGIVPPIRTVGGAISSMVRQTSNREGEALADVRDADGERLGQAEEDRKEQGVHADARLHQAVEPQQRGGLAACARRSTKRRVTRPKSA